MSGAPPAPSSASFAQRLKDPRADLRAAALGDALKPGGPAATAAEVGPLVDDPDTGVQQLAVVLLGQIGAPAVGPLAKALEEKHAPVVRIFAASGLMRIGSAAAPAAEALGKCLSDADEGLRLNAALALSRIGPPALPVLRRALSAEKSAAPAARGLGWMEKDAAPAVEDLRRTATAGPVNARVSASAALVRVTGDPGAGLPALILLISAKDKPAALRSEAIERVGEMQDKGKGAAAALRGALDDADSLVRSSAALALARIGNLEPETGAALTRKLTDPDVTVQTHAAIALERFGLAAKAALPALKNLAAKGDPQVRLVAGAAVRSIEPPPPAPPAAPPKPPGPTGPYTRITAKTAAEVAAGYGMVPDARELLKDAMTPRQFVEALVAKSRYEDAIRFVAQALPKPEAVWWACVAVREAAGPNPSGPIAGAIAAAEKWASTSSEEARSATLGAAQLADVTTPAASAAIAAFLAGPSVGPANMPPVPAPAGAAGDMAANAVIQAARSKEPEKSADRLRAALAKGLEVAAGTSRWK